MSITDLKIKNHFLLSIRLDEIRAGYVKLNVSNQFDESVIESALENFDAFDALAEKWQSEGVAIHKVAEMTWAHQLGRDFA